MVAPILALVGSFVLTAFCVLAVSVSKLPDRYQASVYSASGGAGLTYVFLYLLFELVQDGAPKIHLMLPLGPSALETIFVVILFAVSSTYLIQMSLERTPGPEDDHKALSLLFFGYNFLAGIGLVEEAPWGIVNLTLYALAIGLHILFNELYLLHHYHACHTVRWQTALRIAPILGCILAIVFRVPAGVLYGSLALIAGVTIINTIKHELPSIAGFRPLAFVSGIIAYGALILSTWRF